MASGARRLDRCAAGDRAAAAAAANANAVAKPCQELTELQQAFRPWAVPALDVDVSGLARIAQGAPHCLARCSARALPYQTGMR